MLKSGTKNFQVTGQKSK